MLTVRPIDLGTDRDFAQLLIKKMSDSKVTKEEKEINTFLTENYKEFRIEYMKRDLFYVVENRLDLFKKIGLIYMGKSFI